MEGLGTAAANDSPPVGGANLRAGLVPHPAFCPLSHPASRSLEGRCCQRHPQGEVACLGRPAAPMRARPFGQLRRGRDPLAAICIVPMAIPAEMTLILSWFGLPLSQSTDWPQLILGFRIVFVLMLKPVPILALSHRDGPPQGINHPFRD